MNMKTYKFTKHAEQRFQERGFNNALTEFLLTWGKEHYVGDKTYSISVTKKMLRKIIRSSQSTTSAKNFARDNFERLTKKIILIVDGINIRTVYNRR